MAERFTTKRQPEHRTEQTIEQSRAEQLTALRQSGEHRQLEHPSLQGETRQRRETLRAARHEAEQVYEQAAEQERATAEVERRQRETHEQQRAERQRQASPAAQQERFDKTMAAVQSQLSPSSRAFSKVIHNPAIEKASEVTGNTVARPNALLSGAIAAFVLTLAIYLIARFNGYPLSGAESIAAFALGWLCGLAFDFVRMMMLGRRNV
ncbi:hypothetical protein HG437_002565 [Candidatus Saccharibacteria bacterium]|nr:hypothetical protein [Candidatus Saccharibacteria bacterium]